MEAVCSDGSASAVTYVSMLLDMDAGDDGQVHAAAPLVLRCRTRLVRCADA